MSWTATIVDRRPIVGTTSELLSIELEHSVANTKHTLRNKPLHESDVEADVLQFWIDTYGPRLKEAELNQAVLECQQGTSPELVPLDGLVTRNELRSEVIKRFLNNMVDTEDSERFLHIYNSRVHIDVYTDSQIAALIGWTTTEVANARTKVNTLVTAMDNLDHGKGLFEI